MSIDQGGYKGNKPDAAFLGRPLLQLTCSHNGSFQRKMTKFASFPLSACRRNFNILGVMLHSSVGHGQVAHSRLHGLSAGWISFRDVQRGNLRVWICLTSEGEVVSHFFTHASFLTPIVNLAVILVCDTCVLISSAQAELHAVRSEPSAVKRNENSSGKQRWGLLKSKTYLSFTLKPSRVRGRELRLCMTFRHGLRRRILLGSQKMAPGTLSHQEQWGSSRNRWQKGYHGNHRELVRFQQTSIQSSSRRCLICSRYAVFPHWQKNLLILPHSFTLHSSQKYRGSSQCCANFETSLEAGLFISHRLTVDTVYTLLTACCSLAAS